MCGCKGFAVFVLVIINFVFAAAGLLMLAFGVAAAAKPESIVQLLSYTGELASNARDAGFDLAGILQNSSVFLIVMGVVVALVGLFGCIGACCNVKWMLSVYLVVLIIILAAEIALIIFGALYPEKFKEQTQPVMKKTLDDKFSNDVVKSTNDTIQMPQNQIDLAWASMQFELGCCGAFGISDYQSNNFTRAVPGAIIPVSCCALKDGPGHIPVSTSQFVDFGGCQHSSPAPDSFNKQDCYTAVEALLKGYGRIAIGIAAAIVGIEIILILLAVWVCRAIGTDRSKGV